MTSADIAIIVLYLAALIIVGYKSGRNVKTMRDFSSVNGSLSTTVLIPTIFITIVGGEDFIGTGEVYSIGITFFLINLAQIIGLIGHAYFFAPKILKDFPDKISVGEIMKELYGEPGQIITGVVTLIVSVGHISAQLYCLGYVCSLIPGVSFIGGIWIGSIIMILYSSYGGIKSVISTDLLQFGLLLVALPIITSICLSQIGGIEQIFVKVPSHYFKAFPENEHFWSYIGLFLMSAFPRFSPIIAQRILMAKDTKQIQISLLSVGGLYIPLYTVLTIIAFCAIIIYPNYKLNAVFLNILDNLIPPVAKGLAVVGVLSVIMSTADSHINVAGVSFIKDLLLSVFPKMKEKTQLWATHAATIFLVGYSIIIASGEHRVIDFWVYRASLWAALVTAPLVLYIIGIKTTIQQYLISIIMGASSIILFKSFKIETLNILSPLIGMAVTAFFMICMNKFLQIRRKTQES